MRFSKKSGIVPLVISLFILSMMIAGCGGNKPANDQSKTSQPVKLIANSVWPAENLQCVALQNFADRVYKETNGKVQITVNSGGALGYKGPELLKAVRDGLVPISSMVITQAAGDEKLFDLISLPFLTRNQDEAKKLSNIARPYFDKVCEEKWNQKILFMSPWPPAALWTQKKVESVDDMKGLKVRTYDKNGALVVEATGGTPYPLPFSEVYTALATGTINSVITSTTTAVDGKFWEVLKYHAPIAITTTLELFTINLNEFNKLDKETQNTMLKIGKEIEAEMWVKIAKEDEDKQKLCNDKGITTIKPSDKFMSDLSAITKNIREEWLKTAPPEAKEIIEKFNKEVGRP
ncbi:MAG: TRAP transporter substrate-binding protein [Armatimonadetes bacterium]|nr:TRAP transporter substrate-binding protein [Armatimonadota bacterium]